jgi:predicted phosphodiesterase
MARCVVGEWYQTLDSDEQARFDADADEMARAELHRRIRIRHGDVFGLTSLKAHTNNVCSCSTQPDDVVETVGGHHKHRFSVVLDQPLTSIDSILEVSGHDASLLQIVGDVSIGHRELADGRVMTSCTYRVRERVNPVDVEALVQRVQEAPPVERGVPHTLSDPWFVYQAGDLQIGKRSRDGSTEQIVEHFTHSVKCARQEMLNLQAVVTDPIAGVQLCFPGDCIEGGVSQGGKNAWLTQETVPEQTRIFRRLLLHAIDMFRDIAPQIYVDVVNGNHDQSQRQYNTYPGDGWATEAAISVSEAMELNERAYGHVEVRVPDKWSGSITAPVGDSVVCVAHGHQWPRGKGMRWWDEQSANYQPARNAHVLQHGHIHTYEIETTRDRTRVSSPTFDCGSDWFRETHGGESQLGGLAYLLQGGQISRVSVV